MLLSINHNLDEMMYCNNNAILFLHVLNARILNYDPMLPMASVQETVRSTEDISIKTRSVIELKKLQLLQLQRQLRRCKKVHETDSKEVMERVRFSFRSVLESWFTYETLHVCG